MFRADRLWLLTSICISLFFSTIQMQQSLRFGQLSFPSNYDINGYLKDGLENADLIMNGTFSAFIDHFQGHAPLTSLISALGFLFIGSKDWAPCIINSFIPLVVLFFIHRICGRVPPFVKLALFVIALCAPLSGFLVVDVRTDALWGMLIAASAALMLTREMLESDRSAAVIAGLTSGLAVIAKPSAVPGSGIVLGASVVAVSVLRIAFHGGRRGLWPFWSIYFAAALPIPIIYFYFAWKSTYAYIYDVIFSSHAQGWLLYKPGPFWTEFLFYVTGPGKQLIGPWMPIYLVIATAGIAVAVLRQDKEGIGRQAGLSFVVITLFLLISTLTLKSVFFCAGLAFLFVFGSAASGAYILQHTGGPVRTFAQSTVAIVCALLALTGFHFQSTYYPPWLDMNDASAGKAWNATIDGVAAYPATVGIGNQDLVYLSGIYWFLNPETLNYTQERNLSGSSIFTTVLRTDNFADYKPYVATASAIALLDPSTDDSNRLVPDNIKAKLSLVVQDRREFLRGDSIYYRNQRLAVMYLRRPNFQGTEVMTGLGPERRIANPPGIPGTRSIRDLQSSQLTFSTTFPASGKLLLRVAGEKPAGVPAPIPVLVNGQPEGQLQFHFDAFDGVADLEIFGHPGPAQVRLDFSPQAETSIALRRLQAIDASDFNGT